MWLALTGPPPSHRHAGQVKFILDTDKLFRNVSKVYSKMNLKADFSFGQRLKSERERLSFTQADFAKVGGVGRVSQHMYEQDARSPDARYLLKITEAGADLGYVMWGTRGALSASSQSALPLDALTDIYRLVDEFAKDSSGKALPLEARVKFFQMLSATLVDRNSIVSPQQLRDRLAKLAA